MNKKANKLYSLIRLRGVIETLQILEPYHEKGIAIKDFVVELNKMGSYPNSFYRTEPKLREIGLLRYDLNKENKKVMLITDKGKEFMLHVHAMESLLETKKT